MGLRERIQKQILQNREPILPARWKVRLTSSGALTLTPKDSGTIVITTRTTSTVVTLPPTQNGLIFGLINAGLTSSGGHALSPAAADKIQGKGLSKADDADLVNSAATDAIGDMVVLIGDGTDGWWLMPGIQGTWA